MQHSGLVILPKSRLIRGGNVVPPELANHITAAEYQSICITVERCQTECSNTACFMEIGACAIFCCWCSFCFHPCVVEAMFNSTMPVNQPVLDVPGRGGAISFNLGIMDQFGLSRVGAAEHTTDNSNPLSSYQEAQVQVITAQPCEPSAPMAHAEVVK